MFEGGPEVAEIGVEIVAGRGVYSLRVNVHPWYCQVLGSWICRRVGVERWNYLGPNDIVLRIQFPPIVWVNDFQSVSGVVAVGYVVGSSCGRYSGGRLGGILLNGDGGAEQRVDVVAIGAGQRWLASIGRWLPEKDRDCSCGCSSCVAIGCGGIGNGIESSRSCNGDRFAQEVARISRRWSRSGDSPANTNKRSTPQSHSRIHRSYCSSGKGIDSQSRSDCIGNSHSSQHIQTISTWYAWSWCGRCGSCIACSIQAKGIRVEVVNRSTILCCRGCYTIWRWWSCCHV